MTSVNRPK